MEATQVKQHIKLMKEILTCPICKEPYKTAMMIDLCSHNFCSLCICRYFNIKQECPICGQDVSSSNLAPNRIVDTMMQHHNQLSSLLQISSKSTGENKLLRDEADMMLTTDTAFNPEPANSMQPSVILNRLTETDSISSKTKQDENDDISLQNTPEFSLGIAEFCTQSQGFSLPLTVDDKDTFSGSCDMFVPYTASEDFTKTCDSNHEIEESLMLAQPVVLVKDEVSPVVKLSRLPENFASTRANENQGDSDMESVEKTGCPVCGLNVETENINHHIDHCLAREERNSSLRQNTPKRYKRNNPQVTKLAYNMLSLRGLQRKLREIGLPADGDKLELKRRHQEFLIKYQAEQDKLQPRRISILIEELIQEDERRRASEAVTSRQLEYPYSIRNEADRREHLKKHEKQYQMLEDLARKSFPHHQDVTMDNIEDSGEEPLQELTSHDCGEGIVPETQLIHSTLDVEIKLQNLPSLSALSPELYVGPSPSEHSLIDNNPLANGNEKVSQVNQRHAHLEKPCCSNDTVV
ncbi:E3 ubiquitin-protein ligase RAD18-like isoform X1 [Clavelina lepadiformis]|uniref:E3 ubiquitin-protein ligase RAD18-like isoform X1 n=1 Tax=Clavelina lepadiformis TaxID=159417 RepID=UPI00404274AE